MGFIDPSTLPAVEPKAGWHGRVFAGEVELTLGDETQRVGAGQAVVVPSGLTHAVVVLKTSRAIVVDHPVRHVIGGVEV
jgi:quercetin dioxygenase-like cupin family protein